MESSPNRNRKMPNTGFNVTALSEPAISLKKDARGNPIPAKIPPSSPLNDMRRRGSKFDVNGSHAKVHE